MRFRMTGGGPTLRFARAAVPFLCALVAVGCAGGKPAQPPPAAAPGPQAPAPVSPPTPAVPSAEVLESYPLVRDDPTVAAATAGLAAASPADRPALLMRRVSDTIAVAQGIRDRQGSGVHVPYTAPDYDKYIACYDLATRDLQEVLIAHPGAPEAAEAQFTLGKIHDNPHLDLFDEALEQYRLTIARFPGSPWARQAAARIAHLEDIMGRADENVHSNPRPRPSGEPGPRPGQ